MQQTARGPKVSTEFTSFMRAYQDMVFSTAARLAGNDAQAQDIAQEVFMKAYENFEQLAASPTAGGWLKTVATNLSLNFLTRHRRRWRLFSELKAGDDEDASDPEPEVELSDTVFGMLDAEERRTALEDALRRLPDRQRIPLVLHHLEDLPYQDIAAMLGVTLAKVKSDIHRGRAALLAQLGPKGARP